MRYDVKRAVKPIKNLYQQAELAQEFLNMVRDVLKECEGVWLGAFEAEEHEIAIIYSKAVKFSAEIGYTDKGVYLLDRDFIYSQYERLSKNNQKYSKRQYFSKLFQIGVIRPYKMSEPKNPFVKLSFGNDEIRMCKDCICIPSKYVDFNTQEMKVH